MILVASLPPSSPYVNNNIYYNGMLPIDKCWVVLYNSYVNYDIY
jgi:hypothetical protein